MSVTLSFPPRGFSSVPWIPAKVSYGEASSYGQQQKPLQRITCGGWDQVFRDAKEDGIDPDS